MEVLKHNLLNISQLCDKGLKVIFESNYCTIHQKDSKEVALKGMRHNNIYLIDLDNASTSDITTTRKTDITDGQNSSVMVNIRR